MTVYFIGAGPGDPELLTKKAERMIGACRVCLFAGSLVPPEVVSCAPEGARVLDTATMTLDQTHAEIVAATSR
ncbi:MAG: SAM-dependent methyltransferase, partial [Halocynthiibacter sp.]